jgi:cytochrome c
MTRFRHGLQACILLAVVCSSAVAANESTSSGRRIFESRCASCHEAKSPGTTTLGPSLVGIIGSKAGTGNSGVHSRAAVDSGIVWDRNSLRRFLSEPGREIPQTIMPVRVEDPKELDDLLNYLETLR